MEKDFNKWNIVKQGIESKTDTKTLFFKEREVWFCSFGINVGSEQDGKHELYERPALIYKKITKNTFLGIPLTSIKKEGTWYVPIPSTDSSCIVTQIRLLDAKRLNRKIAIIGIDEFQEVRNRLRDFL